MMIARCLIAALAAIGAAAAADNKPQPKTVAPAELPKDAVLLPSGLYKHTGKNGKVTLYRKTPFSVSIVTDEPPLSDVTPATCPGNNLANRQHPFSGGKPESAPGRPIKVVEEGDSVRFERVTPFGVSKWTSKKSQLTREERELWDCARKSGAAAEAKE
jgi:hypothetical protein